jgi:hypothetical protein
LVRITQLYVDRFNRRDWDGLRELMSAAARLGVADSFAGKFADAPYFLAWKLTVGAVDGEPVVACSDRVQTPGRLAQSRKITNILIAGGSVM